MKRGALPLNALRAFEAAARRGRMRDAAEELGVTYSAISRQIRGLEDYLEVELLEGPRNRLRLTAAAQDMLPDLTRAFDAIEDAVDRVARRGRRHLDVSCLGTLAMRWLIPRLFDFQAKQPEIEVRLTTADGPVDFDRQALDVAIRVGGEARGPCQRAPLFADRVGPVLSAVLAARSAISKPEDLAALPLLHTRTRPNAWPDWLERNGLPSRTDGAAYEHFYFLLEAATAGLGVAIAPSILVRDDLASGRLLAPFGFAPNGLTYEALLPPSPRPEALLFRDWLKGLAAPNSPFDVSRPAVKAECVGIVE